MKEVITKLLGLYLNTISLFSFKLGAKHGAAIFCFPFRPKMKAYQKTYLKENIWKEVNIDGDKIVLYKMGDGPKKILLVHGWMSHSYRWKKYIEKLNLEEYSFYAFDLPGHGLSGGNEVHLPKMGKVIDYILRMLNGVDTIIGHSFGGFSTLFTLFEYDQSLSKKAILLAAPGDIDAFMDYYQKELGVKSRILEGMYDYFQETLGYHLSYFKAPKFAAGISIPGLIIHDLEDKDTPVENSKAMHQAWPNSELLLTKGYGHKLNQEEVINRIKSFLEVPKESSTALSV